jgi:PAS domain S-box-containing protein
MPSRTKAELVAENAALRAQLAAMESGQSATQPAPGCRDMAARMRTELALQAHAQQLQSLSALAQSLTAVLDTRRVTQKILEAALALFPDGIAALYEQMADSELLQFVAMAGPRSGAEYVRRCLRPGEGLVGLVAATRQPLVVPDLAHDPRVLNKAFVAAEGTLSAVILPLIHGNLLLGVLSVQTRERHEFIPEELGLLSSFATTAAIALENARLYGEAEARRHEAEAFADLRRNLTTSLDLDTILQQLANAARALCDSDLASIALRDSSSGDVLLRFRSGGHREKAVGYRIAPGQGVGGWVLKTGRLFRTNNYANDQRISKDFLQFALAEGVVAELAAPIRIDNAVEGVLFAANRAARPFGDHDETVLQRLADHAAIAIRNARLFAKVQRELAERARAEATLHIRARQLATLNELTRALTTELDPRLVTQRILVAAQTLIPGSVGRLWERMREDNTLRVVGGLGLRQPEEGQAFRLVPGEGLIGIAEATRQPVISADVTRDPRYLDAAWAESEGLVACIVLPLAHRGQPVGYLTIYTQAPHDFTDDEVNLLRTFAGQAATAIENARLYDETQRELAERTRAEAALVEKTEELDRFFTMALDLLCIADADGSFRRVNPAWTRVLGYDPSELEGKRFLDLVHPDDLQATLAALGDLSVQKDVLNFVNRYRAKDGSYRWIEWRSCPYQNTLIYAAARDITDRKRAEEALLVRTQQLEAVRTIGAEIARELDLTAVLQLIARCLSDLMARGRGVVWLWDEAAQLLVPNTSPGAEEWTQTQRLRLGEGLVGMVAERREGMIVNDYRRWPFARPLVLERTRITAAIAEPLVYRDRLVGVINLTNGDTGIPFDEQDRVLLHLFGFQAAIAIENARLHGMAISRTRQLATMNELTRSLSTTLATAQVVQKTLAAIQVLFPDCVAEFLEQAADGETLRLIDIVGLRAGKRFIRSEFRLHAGLVGLAAATRQPVTSPDVAQDPRFLNKTWAAEEGVVSAIVLPLMHQDRLHGVLSVLMRTSYRFAQEEVDLLYSFAMHAAIAIENARLYESAQRRAEQLATLNDLAQTLTTTLDFQQVAEQTLQAVRVLIPESLVRLWEHGPEEGLFRHVAGIALTPRAGPEIVRFPPGEGLMGLALQTRQPAISRDVGADPRFRERARAQADGVVSGLMLPLLARDRVSGILAIFTQSPHEFSAEELDLLTSFAAQAAVALENARLYAELKQAYEDLRRAQDELVRSEKLRAVGQLGAGMAHDLNNVLAAILGQTELLKLRTTDPEVREGLSTLEIAATDGAEVVRRLQDFARPRGASPLLSVNLSRVVVETLDITRPRWKDEPERRGVRIDVRTEMSGLPPILGHAPEIREALINLIFNAVDAMPHGGTLSFVARIRGGVGEEAGGRGEPGSPAHPHTSAPPPSFVELSVGDTGVGMPDEVQARIFEPFFTTKGLQGTGLGLSVVYGIMERHGGRIAVASSLGQGTTVTLSFQTGSESPAAAPAAAKPRVPRRLLLIDDDPIVRQTLSSLLRMAGHTVTEAESGPAGLARFDEAAADLVFTDLGMPEMAGWEVARELKARSPALPVVLLTGWGDQAGAESILPGTVDRILGKPVRLDDLLRVIAELTESASPGGP